MADTPYAVFSGLNKMLIDMGDATCAERFIGPRPSHVDCGQKEIATTGTAVALGSGLLFNLHYANAGAAGGKLYFYSENCSAFDHGRGSGTSCNGLTLHEDVIAVDLCGRYFNGRGGTVSNGNTSKHFLAATHVEGDGGDRGSGGPNAPMAIRAGDTSQLWTDMVSVNMPSGSIGFYTTTGAAIRGRREIASPGGCTGGGTFGIW